MSPSRRLRVRAGLELRVETLGEGPPLLLLHGFTGSVEAWGDRQLEALARRHRVLAVDLHGHGRSARPESPAEYRVEAVVRDLGLLLGALDAPRAHWVGYSMGGRVALAAAVLTPERVDRLVLESASPGLESDEERAARRDADEALARRLEEGGVEPFVREWAALPLFESQRRLPQAVREAELRRRLGNDPRALAACLRGLGTGAQPSFWESLPELAAPTLLVTGEEDVKFGGVAERMAALIPECRHVTVPDAGHAVHLEAPETWLEAVITWLG